MKNKKLVIGLFILFICLLSLTIYTIFSSNIDEQEIVIKSMTPVYDETSTIEVDNNNVIFNDKNQVVKYNVVLENTQDYDVKISDIKLSTPTEEFLDYKVEGVEVDDVLEANSTKELTVSLETTGIEGWGRNFADELTANISFERIAKAEEETPKEEEKEEVKQPEAPATNIEEIVTKAEKIEITRVTKDTIEFKENAKLVEGKKLAVWIYSEPKFLGYFDVVVTNGVKQIVGLEDALNKAELNPGEHNIVLETEEKEVLGYVSVYVGEDKELLKEAPQDTTDKGEIPKEEDKPVTDNKPSTNNKDESAKEDEDGYIENPYTSDKGLLVVLVIATGVTGLAIIIVSKNKFAKYTIFIIAISTSLTLTNDVNAEKLIKLPITVNVSFESQNVMDVAYKWGELCLEAYPDECWEQDIPQHFWEHKGKITNIYIQNSIAQIDGFVYEYDVTKAQNGRVKAYLVTNTYDSNYYDLYLQADGIIYPNTDASEYFADMIYLEVIENLEGLDTSNVTDMSYMFRYTGCNSTNLTLDLSSFDTSQVTNMRSMFKNTGSDSTNLTLDLSSFDTSKVTNMIGMFDSTGHNSTNLTLDLSSFDTSKVTDMTIMFNYTGHNSTNLTLDLSSFDTSQVTNMSSMFYGTGYNSTNLTLDLSSFDTSKVTDMGSMFSGTGFNSENFTLDVSSFDTSKVTDMGDMFHGTGHNSENFTLDVSNFDTSNVTSMFYMFRYTGSNSTKLNTSITISNPKTSYNKMFEEVATKEGSKITVNYTKYTEALVDNMIATKSSNSNVVKGNLVVDVDNLSIGDEIHISGEKFNVISQTDDTVTMLAQYNLSTEYKQSTTVNAVFFSSTNGWEYIPGPKEIDIQTWTTNPKTYVNEYVEYLKEELGDDTVTGDLITLTELKGLGCTIPSAYEEVYSSSSSTCTNSPYKSWLINNQAWWSRSAYSTNAYNVWYVYSDGSLLYGTYLIDGGVRPVITISKDTLKGL